MEYPRGDPVEEGYFIYSSLRKAEETFLARKLSFLDRQVFPLDYILDGTRNRSNAEKIFFIDRGPYYAQMISLDNYTHTKCCDEKRVSPLHVYNVRTPGKIVRCVHVRETDTSLAGVLTSQIAVQSVRLLL